jgi:hypothetical protein
MAGMSFRKIFRNSSFAKSMAFKPAGRALKKHLIFVARSAVKKQKSMFRKLRAGAPRVLRGAIVDIAKKIRARAQALAPVDTKYLRKSAFLIATAKASGLIKNNVKTQSATIGGNSHYRPHDYTVAEALVKVTAAKNRGQAMAAIGFWAEYAKPRHEGFGSMANAFFLTRAVDEYRSDIVSHIKNTQEIFNRSIAGKKIIGL